MENDLKRPIEAFEVYLDLDARIKALEAELLDLNYQRWTQMEVIGEAVGVYEGEFAYTSGEGTVVVVRIDDCAVKEVKVIEKLEVK